MYFLFYTLVDLSTCYCLITLLQHEGRFPCDNVFPIQLVKYHPIREGQVKAFKAVMGGVADPWLFYKHLCKSIIHQLNN